MQCVDLNSDLGETVDGCPTADDESLFQLVTSANVACGYHAGDEKSRYDSCARAVRNGVVVGAHVSYRDREGFGRRRRDLAPDALYAEVLEQTRMLLAAAAPVGARVAYIKPHGALYNRVVTDEEQAQAVARAAAQMGLSLLGLPGSAVAQAAREHGVRFCYEAFADRGYRPDGSLVPRGDPGALLADPDLVAQRAVRMIMDSRVEAVDGTLVQIQPDSLCIHGDTPGSVTLARRVRTALEDAGVRLGAFA